ncbi:MAG: hypothetical protein JOS17DRAFT_125532 [Linnemannia elongata]|nr:MAG: hypothetical protein JOS17DRAFT_125532 [Linnemannia elongata]
MSIMDKIFKKKVAPPVPEPGSTPGVCPEETANFFSRLTFTWVQPLMSIGSTRPLEKEDIWEMIERRRADYVSAIFRQEWAKEMAKHKASLSEEKNKGADFNNASSSELKKKNKNKEYRPKLWKALNRTFFYQFWSAGALKVIGDSLQS